MLSIIAYISLATRIHVVHAGGGLCKSAPTLTAAVNPTALNYLKEASSAYIANRSITAGYMVRFNFIVPSSIYARDSLPIDDAKTEHALTFVASLVFSGYVSGPNGKTVAIQTTIDSAHSLAFASA